MNDDPLSAGRTGRVRPMVRGGALAAAAVVVTAFLAAAGPVLAQSFSPIRVDEVRRQPFSETAPVIGRLVARRSGVVAAQTQGPVVEVRVEVGDRVERGAVLAVLDIDRLTAERELRAAETREAEARVANAEAELALARQTLKRIEGLKGSAAFQQARYDDQVQQVAKWRATLAESKAQLARARANLRLVEIDIARARIRAPYPGVVSVRHTEAGAYLDGGQPVVTMVNDRNMEIEADVPAEHIDGLASGDEVRFALNGTDYRATVRALVPVESARTRTRPVRFTPEFGDEPPRLAVDQSVTLYVPTGHKRTAVTVDKDAVIPRRGQNVVFVVEDGIARQRAVKLGAAVGHRFVVEDGLEPGELVVVRGNERLRDGQKVTVERKS